MSDENFSEARFKMLMKRLNFELITLCEENNLSTKGFKRDLAMRLTLFYSEQAKQDWDVIAKG